MSQSPGIKNFPEQSTTRASGGIQMERESDISTIRSPRRISVRGVWAWFSPSITVTWWGTRLLSGNSADAGREKAGEDSNASTSRRVSAYEGFGIPFSLHTSSK